MTHDTFPSAYDQDPFAAPASNRFNQMLHNPNLQTEARRVAQNVGANALQGALESSGVVRDDGSIRKFRLARKLATNPTGLARKAAMGAAQGARSAGRQEAMGYAAAAQQQFGEAAAAQAPQFAEKAKGKLFGRRQQPQEALTQPAVNQDPFGWPTQPESGFPSAPSFGSANFAPAPGFPPAPAYEQPGFPDSPSPWSSTPQPNAYPTAGFSDGSGSYPNANWGAPAQTPNQYGGYTSGHEPFPAGPPPTSPEPFPGGFS